MKWVAIFALFLFLALPVHAATLQGTIYDTNLDVVENVVITISTSPQQRMLSTDGAYTFEVPQGTYTIIALYADGGRNQTSTEQLLVEQEGVFTYDLFLLPDIDFNEDVLEEPDELLDIYVPEEKEGFVDIIVRLFMVFAVFVFAVVFTGC